MIHANHAERNKFESSATNPEFTFGPGNWTTRRVTVPDPGVSDRDWLHSGFFTPGNVRYTREGRLVIQIADARGELNAPSESEFESALAIDQNSSTVSTHDIGMALDETCIRWTQDDHAWRGAGLVSGSQVCELIAQPQSTGVLIHTSLADWDGPIDELRHAALARFLLIEQGQLRFARFILESNTVKVVSLAKQSRLDLELADAIHAVLAAYQCVFDEVKALQIADVARAYLAFQSTQG